MKRIYLFGTVILIIVFVFSLFLTFSDTEYEDRILVDGIENFKPKSSDKEDNFLLFYPADPRVSQESTIVKEVTRTGGIVREYAIKDRDFGRMLIQQKPNDFNHLYVSFFGDATIDNYFFTYNIERKKFNKVDFNYFKYPVGVDHILHYGDDVLFQTIVSYKTGNQNTNKNNDFNMSISNYISEKSFETEYGYSPKWTPLLGFNKKIFYGTSGEVKEKDKTEYPGIGIIDLDHQLVHYESPESNDIDLYPLYSNRNRAYIVSDSGKLYAYNKELKYEVFEPFNNFEKQDVYYSFQYRPLMIDDNTALYNVFSDKKGNTVGLLTFEPVPSFQPLKKNYLKAKNNYKFIYHDHVKEEIYVLCDDGENYTMLVLDKKTLNLKVEFPVDYGHLLDFIVRI